MDNVEGLRQLDQKIMPTQEVLDGRYARIYAIIDGRRYMLCVLKDFEGKVELNHTQINRLGTAMAGNLSTGAKGTWKAKLYYVTDEFRKLVIKFLKTGVETYFDIQTTNYNPNGTTGEHTVVYRDCRINGAIMSKIDVESNVLDEDIEGTFEDCDMPEQFKVIDGMVE